MYPTATNSSSTLSNVVNTFDQTFISDEVLLLFTSVVDTWISLAVASLGIVSNVLTLVVFRKMGFKDTVTIAMTNIAFWDLVRVLCGAVHRLYGPMSLASQSLGRSWQNMTIANVVYLQNIASNVSYVIGGYVALERCLCISVPFRVKILVTHRVTLIACVTLSVTVISTLLPSLLLCEIKWIPAVSISDGPIAVYQFSPFHKVHGESYLEFYKYINLLYPVVSLTSMTISTVVIFYHLQKSSGFRKKIISAASKEAPENSNPNQLSRRDKQVVKMLLVVISSYMLVLVPRIVNYIVELFVHEYFLLHYYNNIFLVVIYSAFLLDFINSALTIFIFYSMSTNFRSTLNSMFLNLTCLTKSKH